MARRFAPLFCAFVVLASTAAFAQETATTLNILRRAEPIAMIELQNGLASEIAAFSATLPSSIVPNTARRCWDSAAEGTVASYYEESTTYYDVDGHYLPRICNGPATLTIPAHAVVITAVQELPGVNVAVFNQCEDLQNSMERASIFIEQGTALLSHSAYTNDSQHHRFAGFDLQGADLIRFMAQYLGFRISPAWTTEEAATESQDIQAQFFANYLIPTLTEQPDLILIAVASTACSGMTYEGVLSHEMIHAQYFADAAFRASVQEFWNTQLPPRTRSGIIGHLSESYDASNAYLLANEYAAYSLDGVRRYDFMRHASAYVEPLRQWLVSRGTPVLPISAVTPSAPLSDDDAPAFEYIP